MREGIRLRIGAERAAELEPEIDAIHAYASRAHRAYLDSYEARQQWLRDRGQTEMPPVETTSGEITYGTKGPRATRPGRRGWRVGVGPLHLTYSTRE